MHVVPLSGFFCATFWPLMVFYCNHCLDSLSWPDLLGFGLILMKNQYALAFIYFYSQIHNLSDPSLCKDVSFFQFLGFLFLFYWFIFFAVFTAILWYLYFTFLSGYVHLWQIYCREKDLLYEQFV
jgi:hypothetical protein